MFRKVSNKSLGIIFTLLLVIFAVLYFTNTGKKERSFREKLVDIDSSQVTKIVITAKANNFKPYNILKKDGKWRIELNNGKTAPVTMEKMGYMIKELMELKPKRLAARDENKWSEFQVDSSGTHVEVYEGDDKTLDLIIGRFNYQPQPRNISTYVRLNNDVDVYEVDGFLSVTYNQPPNSFRDGTVIKSDYNKWNKLVFDYNTDSSFTLEKNGNKWFINGEETDSAQTVNYLRKIASFTRNNFADDAEISQQPSFTLLINGDDMDEIKIEGYKDENHYVILSSQNPETKFDATNFGKEIFVGKSAFFK